MGYLVVALSAHFILFDQPPDAEKGDSTEVAADSTEVAATEEAAAEVPPTAGVDEALVDAAVVQWVFLIVLFLWFVHASWLYLRPREQAARALNDGKGRIRSESGKGSGTSSVSRSIFPWHEELRTRWERFESARKSKHAGDTHSAPRDQSPVSTADFFTMKSVLGVGSSKLPTVLPGIFAAIGLLGTFVGIVMGLEGIDLDADSDTRLEAISQLMAGMSTAFLTSVAGITQSIWWRIAFRRADHVLERALDAFLDQAREAFPVEQPHETLMRIAGSVAPMDKTASGIKSAIQTMGQDLSVALERHLNTYVAEPLRQLNTEFGERQQQALREMVESFQQTLVSSVGEKLTAFSEALGSATDHQVNAAKELGRFFDRLDEVADTQTKLLQRSSQIAEVFEAGMERLAEAKTAIAEAGVLAQKTMEAARDLIRECQRQLEAQERASESAARSWSKQVKATKHLHRELRRLTTDLAAKVEEFRTLSAQTLAEAFQSFDSEMAKVTEHLSGTMNELREYAGLLAGAVQPLPDAVTGLRNTTDVLTRASAAHAESIAEGIQDFKEVQAEMVAGMERSLAAAEAAFGQLPVLTAAMQAGQQGLARVSEDIRARLESLSDTIEASGERTVTEIARVLESAGNASGRVETAAEAVVAGLQALKTRTDSGTDALTDASDTARKLMQAIDRSVSTGRKALDQLPALTEQVSASIEAMRTGYEEFASASKEITGRLESLTSRTEESGERTLKEMTGVLDSASTASERVDAAAREVVAGLRGLGNSTSSGSDALTTASRATDALTRAIKQVRQQLADLGDAAATRTDTPSVDTKAIVDAAEGLAEKLDKLGGFVERLPAQGERNPAAAPPIPALNEEESPSRKRGDSVTPGQDGADTRPVDLGAKRPPPTDRAVDAKPAPDGTIPDSTAKPTSPSRESPSTSRDRSGPRNSTDRGTLGEAEAQESDDADDPYREPPRRRLGMAGWFRRRGRTK